ncbi:unnamed protein product [Phyllotreta striolata]|uniref:Uncharacterized protein n=1 Tax=Phyllotreta striolata TaxID=444603 RepID=A0A9N9XJZ3_PHYSR|nr:unnamed protein product [Phyllotreta striolata]
MDSSSDSSESDDCDGLRRKALQVILPTDFNPDSEPQDGTEYLQHVIYERRKIRKYLRADIDISKYRKNQTFNIHQKNEVETFTEYLPSIEWQVKKLKDFQDFKLLIDNQIDKNYVPKVGFFSQTQFSEMLNTEGPKLTVFLKYTQAVKLGMLEIITKTLHECFNNWNLKDSVAKYMDKLI